MTDTPTPGPHVTVQAKTDRVAIWSGEHHAWWGPDRCGYFTDAASAGLYTLADAIDATHHVGPEKRITILDARGITVRIATEHAIALAAIAYVDRNEKPFTKENVTLWHNLRDAVNIWKASQIEAAELADGVVKEIKMEPTDGQ